MARHWLLLCSKRKGRDGQALEPKQNEINSICRPPSARHSNPENENNDLKR